MAIVGSAHVIIRAITDKLQGDIQKGLNDAMKGAGSSGASGGDEWKKNFLDHAKINDSDVNKLTNPIKNNSSGGKAGESLGQDVGRGVRRGIEREEGNISNAGGNSGRKAGAAFKNGFEGSGALKSMAAIGLRIATLVPVLTALAAAISNVVSGLFAMVSAASKAVEVLAVLPGLVSAVAQAGGTLVAAFHGVGSAIAAGFKATTAVTGRASAMIRQQSVQAARAVRNAAWSVGDAERQSARDIVLAQRAVGDAKVQLQLTYMTAADAERNAIHSVQEAEFSLAQSQQQVMIAQRELTLARIDAKNKLIDLKFAEQGGLLAERQAVMDLTDARYKLNAVNELPPNNRIRKEAELQYEQAKLNLAQQREQNKRNSADLKRANKDGVNGSLEVIQAQRGVVDAQHALKDAIYGVTTAMRQQKEVGIQNAVAIRNAQLAVKDAEYGLADAYRQAPRRILQAKEALQQARVAARLAGNDFHHNKSYIMAYNQALAMLSPSARDFVRYVVSMRPALKQLQEQAASGLFPGLTAELKTLSKTYLPVLGTIFHQTGQAIADGMGRIVKAITTPEFVHGFKKNAEANLTTIRRMGSVIGSLVVVLNNLMRAARPVTAEFTKWFKTWADGLATQTSGKKNIESMRDSIQRAAQVFRQIVRIIKNLVDGLHDLGKAASPSGHTLLDAFEKATHAFATFTDTKKHRQELRKFFSDTATNFLAISGMLKVLGREFLKLGTNPALGKIAKSLEPVIVKLGKLMSSSLASAGPAIVAFLSELIDLFQNLADSKAFPMVIGIFTHLLHLLNSLFNLKISTGGPFGQKLDVGGWLKYAVAIGAVFYALKLMKKLPGVSQAWWLLTKHDGVRGWTIMTTKIRSTFQAIGTATGKAVLYANQVYVGVRNWAKVKASAAKTFLFEKGQILKSKVLQAQTWAAQRAVIAKKFIFEKAQILKNKALQVQAWAAERAAAAKKFLFEKTSQAKIFVQSKAIAAWRATKAAAGWLAERAAIAKTIVAEKLKLVWDKLAMAVTKAWTAIQWLFNAAQLANPWVLGLAALVAIGAALVLAYKKFDWFRKIVDGVWHAIVKGAQWVWDILFGHSIFPDIQDAMAACWDKIGGIIKDAWAVIKVVFDLLAGFVKSVLIPIIGIYVKVYVTAFKVVAAIIKWAWSHVIQPALKALWWYITNVIVPVIKFLWTKIVKPYFTLIANIIKWAWAHVIQPVLKAFWWYLTNVYIPVIKFLWAKVVKPYFTLIANIIKWAWQHVIQPALKAMWWYLNNVLIPIFKFLWAKVIKPLWESIGDKIRSVWQDFISPVFDALKSGLDTIKDAFHTAVDRIGNVWDKLKELTAKPVRFVVDTVYNNGILKVVNAIPGVHDLSPVKINFARGGVMPGYTPGRDVHEFSSPTGGRLALSGGEAIMRPEWTRAIGGERAVHEMNRAARMGRLPKRQGPGYFLGGVLPLPGATSIKQHPPSEYPFAKWAGDLNWPGRSDYGKPIVAWKSGVAHPFDYGSDRSYGRGQTISHAANESSLYAHMSRVVTALAGKAVHAGQTIGYVGDYGNTGTPPTSHLHFEVRGGGIDLAGTSGSVSNAATSRKVFNPLSFLHLGDWQKKLGGLGDWGKYLGSMTGNVVPTLVSWAKDKITGVFGHVVGWAKDKLTVGGGSSGTSTPGAGNSVTRWTPVVQSVLKELGKPTSWTGDVLHRINQESGGNPAIVNKWDSNWTAGHPSVGLMQVIKGTFDTYAGRYKGTGPFSYGVSTDAHANIYAGLNYAAHRYASQGGIPYAMMKPGGYDSGGVAFGTGYMPKNTIEPERVLSPRQTESFERLVKMLDSGQPGKAGGDTINLDVHVPQEASAREVVDGIVYELRRLKHGGRYG